MCSIIVFISNYNLNFNDKTKFLCNNFSQARNNYNFMLLNRIKNNL